MQLTTLPQRVCERMLHRKTIVISITDLDDNSHGIPQALTDLCPTFCGVKGRMQLHIITNTLFTQITMCTCMGYNIERNVVMYTIIALN